MIITAFPVGFFAGLFGIGGGLITVPFLFFIFEALGIDKTYLMHLAVGTSFAIIIPTSMVSVYTHNKHKSVDPNIIKTYGLFVIIGVFLGTTFAAIMKTKSLVIFFTMVVFFLGTYLLVNSNKQTISKNKFKLHFRIIFGLISGYYSGFVDKIIMWLINVTWSIPTLLLVIAITLALGKGFWQVFIAVGLTMWVEVARLVRGQVKTLKERKFIVAAKVMGFSDFRIIMFHILPNIISPIIVISAANFAASILIESGLSFLGLGAQPPMISWGLMIKDHYNYIILGEPFLAIIPGICIMLLVTSFMLLGNSLRDILDVKN